MPIISSKPWIAPSSPYLPCSAIEGDLDAPDADFCRNLPADIDRNSIVSFFPQGVSTALPLARDTSRSDDIPPEKHSDFFICSRMRHGTCRFPLHSACASGIPNLFNLRRLSLSPAPAALRGCRARPVLRSPSAQAHPSRLLCPVHDEIRVFVRDLGVSHAPALHLCRLDQFARRLLERILENRSCIGEPQGWFPLLCSCS